MRRLEARQHSIGRSVITEHAITISRWFSRLYISLVDSDVLLVLFSAHESIRCPLCRCSSVLAAHAAFHLRYYDRFAAEISQQERTSVRMGTKDHEEIFVGTTPK